MFEIFIFNSSLKQKLKLLLKHHKYFCTLHNNFSDCERITKNKIKNEFIFHGNIAQDVSTRTQKLSQKSSVLGDNYNFEVKYEKTFVD